MSDVEAPGNQPTPKPKKARWIWRVFWLLGTAALMIGFLTAAQISHAYLTASGGDGGTSAVAIRDAALSYQNNRLAYRAALEAIDQQQRLRVQAVGVDSDASLYEYFYKIQFRRLIFGCYPNAYKRAKAGLSPGGQSANELSWDFLLAIYQEAKSDAETTNPASQQCRAATNQTSAAVSPFRRSRLAEGTLFQVCPKAPREEMLECLWDNVTASVGLQELTQRYQASIDTGLRAARGDAADLNSNFSDDKALADPSGRAAVAAWWSLHGPIRRQCEELGRQCEDASPTTGISPGTPPPAVPTDRPNAAPVSDPRSPALSEIALRVLGWLAVLPSRMVALIVTMPVLAQSAVMAMAAGALGGGMARIWQLLGYRRPEPKEITDAAEQAKSAMELLAGKLEATADPDLQASLTTTSAEISTFRASLDKAATAIGGIEEAHLRADAAPVATAMFCGSVAALILWLLTTSGLFVLSGGDNVSSASPNVLLALALIAGLAYARVIELVFSIAEGALKR